MRISDWSSDCALPIYAAEVLKHLSARDVQAVGSAMAALSSVSREHVEHALDKLNEDMGRQTSLGVGTEEYIRKILVNALGENKRSEERRGGKECVSTCR